MACVNKKNEIEIRTGVRGEKRVRLLNREHDFEEVLTTTDAAFTVKSKGFSVILVEIV